jgi:DNA-binding NtrC family response regulator
MVSGVPHAAAEQIYEMRDKCRNVFPALSQHGQQHGEDMSRCSIVLSPTFSRMFAIKTLHFRPNFCRTAQATHTVPQKDNRAFHQFLQLADVATSKTLDDSDRALILETLEQTRWLVGGPHGAAAKLGLKRTTLIAIMRRLNISRPIHKEGTDERGIASETIRPEDPHF